MNEYDSNRIYRLSKNLTTLKPTMLKTQIVTFLTLVTLRKKQLKKFTTT